MSTDGTEHTRADAALPQAKPVAQAEFHVWEQSPEPSVMDGWVGFWSQHLQGARRILDVACGEGHFLAALQRAGHAAEGIELTPALVARAKSQGLTVHEGDAVAFIEREGGRYDAFFLMDFIEHIPFDAASRLIAAIPDGALLVVMTPNTNSVMGHQFYLQVPSHVSPYSPFVLGQMLERARFDTLATGSLYGGLPWTGLRRRVTEWLLVKLLGTTTAKVLTEGANFYVVARKRRIQQP